MLIWPTAHRVGRSEQAVAEVLSAVPAPGIALLGVRLPGAGGREIDVLVIEPRGVTTIEAKGTPLRGPVQASANGEWLIGGQPAGFAGHANPVGQATVQAHRLRELCESQGFEVGFVPALVVVCGDVRCDPAVVSGGVWATDVANVPAALTGLRRGRPLSRPVVRSILRALSLGTRTPDDAALDAAGFPRDDGSMPPGAWTAPPAAAYAPPPQRPAPQPSYGYYAPPPRRRKRPRNAPAYGRPNPMEQWPAYRVPRGHRPPPSRPRSGSWRVVSAAMLLLALALFAMSLAANGGETPEEPTPSRRPPAVRQTPRR